MTPERSPQLHYMPCAEFEQQIHAFVDRELAQADSKNLLVHLELCDECRGSLEALRQSIRAHRQVAAGGRGSSDGADAADVDVEREIQSFDAAGFFAGLSSTLLTGNVDRLAELMYELGKAYFIAGNDTQLVTFIHRKAVSIERARAEGERLAKESSGVAETAGRRPRNAGRDLRRAREMFRSRSGARATRMTRLGARSGRASLDNARRFLEECVMLRPGHCSARLYLGVYFQRIDRPLDAIAQYRKLLQRPELDRTLRAMTLQALGNAYAYQRDYKRAIRCFDDILSTGIVDDDPRFFTVLVSLAMFHAKLERFDRSTEFFGRLVDEFPAKVMEARRTLERASEFRGLLAQRVEFRDELVKRYPVLFRG